MIYNLVVKIIGEIIVNAAAFVGNKKMMLPEGVERKDNRNYEEVYIPLPPISELPVGDELIPVSTLDDVSFIAVF
jgi:hypothetical protein